MELVVKNVMMDIYLKICFVLMVFIALKKMVKEIAENAKMIINISHNSFFCCVRSIDTKSIEYNESNNFGK